MSAALAFLFGTALALLFKYAPYACSLAALIAAIALVLRRAGWAAVALALGICLALVRLPADQPQPSSATFTFEGAFEGLARESGDSYRQDFRVLLAADGYAGPGLIDTIVPEPMPPGRRYKARMSVVVPRARLNPGAYEASPYGVLEIAWPMEGGHGAWFSRARMRLDSAIKAAIKEPDAAAIVSALIVGQRSGISERARDAFRDSGLAHLMSISGTHFGFLGLFMYIVIGALISRLPEPVLRRMTLYLSPRQAAAAVTLPFILFYLGLSGASPPSVRAAITMSLFLFGVLIAARGRWQPFVAVAAIIIVLHEPKVMGTLSFLLSFAAVIFIGYVVRSRMIPAMPKAGLPALELPEVGVTHVEQLTLEPESLPVRMAKNVLARPFQVSLAATFGVLPIVVYAFHYISLIGPLANIVATPFAGFVLVPVAMMDSVLYLATGSFYMAGLVESLSRALLWMADLFASLPLSALSVKPLPAIMVPLYYACVLPWIMRRGRPYLMLALVPFMAAAALIAHDAYLGKQMSITFLDAGWADTSVAEMPDGSTIVIDTGRTGYEASGYLKSQGIEKIDVLVLTHPHADHIGGAGMLAERYRVGRIWDNGRIGYPDESPASRLPRRALVRGESAMFGDAEATALHPHEGFYSLAQYSNMRDNDSSLVLRLSDGALSALMAGDLQAEGMEDMASMGPRWLHSSALKLPHHGRNMEHLEWFVGLVSPELLVMTAEDATYEERVAAMGIPLLNTGTSGAIKLYAEGGALRHKTYAGFAPSRAHSWADERRNLRWLASTW